MCKCKFSIIYCFYFQGDDGTMEKPPSSSKVKFYNVSASQQQATNQPSTGIFQTNGASNVAKVEDSSF